MNQALLTIVAFVMGATPVQAQPRDAYLDLVTRYGHARLLTDAFVLPGTDVHAAWFTVRVPNSLLVFVKEREALSEAPFIASVEVAVQVRAEGRLVAEKSWRGTHRAESYEVSTSRSHDLEAQVRVPLEPARYVYRVLVRDLNSDATIVDGPSGLDVPDFPRGAVGTPIAVTRPPSIPGRLSPVNLGGDIPYGEDSWLLIPVTVRKAPPATSTSPDSMLRYVVRRRSDVGRERDNRASRRDRSGRRSENDWSKAEEAPAPAAGQGELVVEGSVPIGDWLAIASSGAPGGDADGIPLHLSSARDSTTFLVPVPVRAGDVRDGRFVLETSLAGTGTASSVVTAFGTHWRDMPLSLHSAEVAIRMLHFIEGKERIRDLLRGSEQEQADAIRGYWEERDPTPGTVWNELMAEFYRRIDHAASEFRAAGGPLPDGLRSDQARVYIVQGPPADVRRSFPASGGVEEVWTYEGGRQFVFWAASSMEPLALKNR